MSRTIDVVRAWKDPEYRESLTAEELAALPPHPAGMIELSRAELGLVSGGGGASTPTIVMSNGGSGGTQCTAHSCPPGIFDPTIYINPGTLAGGGR